jgi:hypothetical protein
VTGVTAGILGEEVDVYTFGSQMSIQDVAHQVKFVPAMDYKSLSRLTAINSAQASYLQRFIEAALVAYPEKIPASYPRPPSIHIPAILFVICAELSTQGRLFIEYNEEVHPNGNGND